MQPPPSIESFECITDHENFDELVLNPVILEVAYIQIMLYMAECLLILNIKKKQQQNRINKTQYPGILIYGTETVSVFFAIKACAILPRRGSMRPSRGVTCSPEINQQFHIFSTRPHPLSPPPKKKKKKKDFVEQFPLYTCSLEVNDPLFLKTLGGPLSVPSQYQN